MSMGIVDTLMVGPLGPAAISATGMGSAVFTAIAIFGMGLMLGLDALVSQAHGARRLVRLGAPAASQVTLEVTVFAAATALAGRLDPTSSAANQIALNIASLAFMVPLGLASASAVRVGHAVGAREPHRAIRAGWTALGVGAAAMAAIAVIFVAWPGPMLRAFTEDSQVVQIGTNLLAIAAAFQLFDGTQAVAPGSLRGLGETAMPMAMNIVGHWVLGLPVGYALCFTLGWGVVGLWIGLSIGLIFVAITLTVVWARRAREIA